MIGAAAAVVACALLAALLGPVVLASVSEDVLWLTIGVLVLLLSYTQMLWIAMRKKAAYLPG